MTHLTCESINYCCYCSLAFYVLRVRFTLPDTHFTYLSVLPVRISCMFSRQRYVSPLNDFFFDHFSCGQCNPSPLLSCIFRNVWTDDRGLRNCFSPKSVGYLSLCIFFNEGEGALICSCVECLYKTAEHFK